MTWPGAHHHVMNRGYGGEKVFGTDKLKKKYLEFMKEHALICRIRIFAYCLMDNHIHIILENSSGRMSEFMKRVHTAFGIYYRKLMGGRGYVFQDRFKSTVIQNESYLLQAIVYVLQNPARGGVVADPFGYPWSSIGFYYSRGRKSFLDTLLVESLFGSAGQFRRVFETASDCNYKERKTKFGPVLGDPSFVESSESLFDRRKHIPANLSKRDSDKFFEPVSRVIREYENQIGMRIVDIETFRHEGKRQRGELLVRLRDRAGLKYSEIYEVGIFSDMKFSSIGRLYSDTKKRLADEKKTQKPKVRP